jgi:alkylresorcinol/alkylpyrone synthase
VAPGTDPILRAVGRALPPHRADQETIIGALRGLWADRHHNVDRLAELHRAARVEERHLALPLDEYRQLGSFAEANRRWTELAVELGAAAIEDALRRAGLTAADVDHLLFVTTTGVATPSIDARLAGRIGARPDLLRTPIFGLGCAAGVAGTARAADYLRAYPDRVAVVLSVELCSLTLQQDDLSVANVIATGLFGDGAAAVVLAGAARGGDGPRLVASAARLYEGTDQVMGWQVVDSGFRVLLAAEVPRLIRAHIAEDVDGFLAGRGLERAAIRHWIAHPGGPRVLEAVQAALALPAPALARSWRSLARVGNLSSASALFVLAEHLDDAAPVPGDLGVLLAMGPGFAAELALLAW